MLFTVQGSRTRKLAVACVWTTNQPLPQTVDPLHRDIHTRAHNFEESQNVCPNKLLSTQAEKVSRNAAPFYSWLCLRKGRKRNHPTLKQMLPGRRLLRAGTVNYIRVLEEVLRNHAPIPLLAMPAREWAEDSKMGV